MADQFNGNEETKKNQNLLKINLLQFMNRDNNLVRLIIITAVVFILMTILNPGKFFAMDNFQSMSVQFPELGLLALAMTLAMVTGGIDLSLVGIANLAGICAALILTKLIPQDASNAVIITFVTFAICTALLIGLICGFFNGLLISRIGVPPILATLGSMLVYTGISIVITKGYAVFGYPDQFLYLGEGKIFIFPIPLLIFVFFAVVVSILLNRTEYGVNLYMLGTNPKASMFSGIKNHIVLLRTYMFTGLIAGVTGVVMISGTNSAKSDYGSSYILQSVLVAVLGGVNPAGGFGTVFGVVAAVLSLQFLSSGFNMLRFSNFAKEFTWGAFLLLIMAINYIQNTRKAKK